PELLLEALQQYGIGGHVRRHDLYGDDVARAAVAAAPDRAHAALRDLLHQIIVADALHRPPGGFQSHSRGLRDDVERGQPPADTVHANSNSSRIARHTNFQKEPIVSVAPASRSAAPA